MSFALTAFDLLPLALLGAVLGLDVVSFPQAMYSRPIVAATLAGALMGHAAAGLVAGVALELVALETLPFGASRYPEWGSASVVGGALFAAQPDGSAGALTLAVVCALATAWVSGWSMVLHRRLIARLARPRLDQLGTGTRRTVIGLQLSGLTLDLLRGGSLTFVTLLALNPLVRFALTHWSGSNRLSRAVVVGAAGAVAAAAAWKIFHALPGARWLFLGGLATGLLALQLR